MSLLPAVLRRTASSAVTLVAVSLVVFALAQLAPADPLDDSGGETGTWTPEAIAHFRAEHHLDEPVLRRYARWCGDVVRGDLGRSFLDRRPVAEKIGERLPLSLALNGLSLVLMASLAVPLGIFAAHRPGSWADRLTAATSYALFSVPVFWAALLLQIVFAVQLGWLPLFGVQSEGAEALGGVARLGDRLRHLALPVACLSYGGLAYLSRFVRSSLLESGSGDAQRAARARGRSALGTLWTHGMRRAAVPMLTLAGFLLPRLVGGSVVVEHVFGIPGVGRLFFESARGRDLPTLLALTLLAGAATLLGVLFADVTYAVLDPRTRRAR